MYFIFVFEIHIDVFVFYFFRAKIQNTKSLAGNIIILHCTNKQAPRQLSPFSWLLPASSNWQLQSYLLEFVEHQQWQCRLRRLKKVYCHCDILYFVYYFVKFCVLYFKHTVNVFQKVFWNVFLKYCLNAFYPALHLCMNKTSKLIDGFQWNCWLQTEELLNNFYNTKSLSVAL